MSGTPVLEDYGVRLLPLHIDHLRALLQTHDESTWTWMSEAGRMPEQLHALVQRALTASAARTTQAWTTTLHRQG